MDRLIEGTAKLGINLDAKQLRQFQTYYQELLEWNKKFNLTTITDYREVQVKHFLDSLTLTLVLRETEIDEPSFNIIDVGTGAGFPGIPLRILFTQPRVALLDSTTKKAAFLKHIIQKLELNTLM